MTPTIRLAAAALLCAASGLAAQNDEASQSQAALVSRLERALDSLTRAGQFSGVVLLTKESKAVYQRAAGMADREAGRPNTVETVFNLGSINKAFTSTAIRQLAAQGKLDLDSTLAKYWPDYPNPDVARKVTIRQLIEHRSGIGGNIFDPPSGGTRLDLRHNRDFLPLFVGEPLRFEPGSRQEYSNAGYMCWVRWSNGCQARTITPTCTAIFTLRPA